MSRVVEIGDEFQLEFLALQEEVRIEILALSRLLQQFGPQLGRPRVDTLNGSRHSNMKELPPRPMASGELPLPSTRGARRFCWSREINPAAAKSASTAS